MITAPGIYDLPAAAYHADPCVEPSLSNSIGHLLLTRSPRHAWHAHPRLNPPDEQEEPTREQEEGTALHALILQDVDLVEVIEAPDWRKKEAQQARDAARKAGRVPVLRHRADELEACAHAVLEQLRQHKEAALAFTAGKPEQTMIWREDTRHGPVICRALVDWLPDDPRGWIDDLKTVGGTAEPGSWGKNMLNAGYATQAMFYMRGARALGRDPRGFRFIVAERDAPYCLSVCSLAPAMEDLAAARVKLAIETWAECLHGKRWPSYPPFISWIEPKPWDAMADGERELRDEFVRKSA
jgi:hypothetical protein